MIQLPAFVQSVVTDLAADPNSKVVWLIGSRASGTQTPQSDWDLLLFSDREPAPTACRVEGVDVLHVGPSGKVLLEGQPASMELAFSDFQWKEVVPGVAEYTGLELVEYPAGTARDSDEPAVKRSPARGLPLWSRESRPASQARDA